MPVPLYADAFPERPALEEALSHALLDRAGLGALPEATRLAVPGSLVSFGRLDALAPGFPAAVAAAREHGYAAVHRLVGGRAAVFNGTHGPVRPRRRRSGAGTGDRRPLPRDVGPRGRRAARARRGGPAGRRGPRRVLPRRLQRQRGRAAEAGRDRAAGHPARLVHPGRAGRDGRRRGARRARAGVRRARDRLGPDTTGAVEDVAPGVTAAGAVEALREAFATRHELVPAELDEATRQRAHALAPAHDAETPVARDPGAEKVLGA